MQWNTKNLLFKSFALHTPKRYYVCNSNDFFLNMRQYMRYCALGYTAINGNEIEKVAKFARTCREVINWKKVKKYEYERVK